MEEDQRRVRRVMNAKRAREQAEKLHQALGSICCVARGVKGLSGGFYWHWFSFMNY